MLFTNLDDLISSQKYDIQIGQTPLLPCPISSSFWVPPPPPCVDVLCTWPLILGAKLVAGLSIWPTFKIDRILLESKRFSNECLHH